MLHPQTARQFEVLQTGRAGGYIFHGLPGMGKSTAAAELARQLNCQGDQSAICASCRLFQAGSHPDYTVLSPDPGREVISIEQVRRLSHTLALKVYRPAGTRIVVIDPADHLTVEAQNTLLKLIEEPPPATRFVLVAEYLDALLPTVRSRLAPLFFARLAPADLAAWLTDTHGISSAAADELAQLANGAPGQALTFAKDPTALAAQREIVHLAEHARTATLFERLLLARQLIDNKVPLSLWAGQLHQRFIAHIQTEAASPAGTQQLTALEDFRRGLQAGVAPRIALERLMLEL